MITEKQIQWVVPVFNEAYSILDKILDLGPMYEREYRVDEEYFKGKPTKLFKHINVCHIRVSYDDVKLHSIIKLIGRSFADGVELYVFDFEIPTMEKCYVNLEIEYIDGYCYKAKYLPWRYFLNYN